MKIELYSSDCFALERANLLVRHLRHYVFERGSEIQILKNSMESDDVVSVSADPTDKIMMITRDYVVPPNEYYRKASFKMNVCKSGGLKRTTHEIRFTLHLRGKLPELDWRLDEIGAVTVLEHDTRKLSIFRPNPSRMGCLSSHDHSFDNCIMTGMHFELVP